MINEYVQSIKSGASVYEHISKVIEEAKKINNEFHPFITIDEEGALKQAKEIDAKIKKGDVKGNLLGVPISVKDAICTKGIRTTACSKMLEKYIPPFDATVVERVKKEGGIIFAKTVMDEFGFGGFCVNVGKGFQKPLNPNDPERATGGSSGGAACSIVASKTAQLAIAESTGGSITAPSSFCGAVGITPTYGRVSRYGLIDYASSLDKIGPIGKNVSDASLLLSVIAGHDNYDQTTLSSPVPDYNKKLSLKGLRIGIPKQYYQNADKSVSDAVWSAIKKIESEGATYEECDMPTTDYTISAYYLIAMCEASTNLSKLCGLRYGLEDTVDNKSFNNYFSQIRAEGFGDEAKRRIMIGTFARMAGYRDQYYLRAMKVRTLIINDFKKQLDKYDILLTPSMPILAPRFDELNKLEPCQHYALDVCTTPPNTAGMPHVSLPCNKINNLPVGMQLICDHLQEDKLIGIARSIEEVLA